MHPIVDKIRQRFQDQAPRDAARSLLHDVAQRVIDPHREIILMEIDLANPKAHPQKADLERCPFVLEDLGPSNYDRLIEMLEASERWRIDIVQLRRSRGTPGFVAIEEGKVVGFFYYEHTTPDRPPHPDLEWLGIELGPKEVYSFDSFIPVPLRGRGTMLFRLAYQRLHQRGFERSRGYVYATEKAPLFTYRVIGWKETGRIFEHRIAGRWVVVDRVLYRLNRFDRTRLAALPIPDVVAEWVRSTRDTPKAPPPTRGS